jgi:O-acetyl-ADP-ribose deacetylase (regulator of RNase III)
MIHVARGNLLEADAEALVNTVNCVGVMGKGVALQFKQAFPENFRVYARACSKGEVVPGAMLVVPTGMIGNPKYVVNFPTKRHWKGKARLDDIREGLVALRGEVARLGIKSIAVPPLGCGSGGLQWNHVRPLIETALADLKAVEVLLYPPEGAPAPDEMVVRTRRPRLTPARALVVALMDAYAWPGYRLSMLELEKLAYFLHRVGALPRLEFVKGDYGPYSNTLYHVLQGLEGHYIRGLGDRARAAEVAPIPQALAKARAYLETQPDAEAQFVRVAGLIAGYETPYSMELLASVDWVAHESSSAANDASVAVAAVHSWNERKRRVFTADHIRTAWHHLREHGMIDLAQA